jgi:serine acetyltransferase
MIAPVSSQSELQNRIDELTHRFLETHADFVAVAIEKDAALKGLPIETVKDLLHVYPGVIALAVHEEAHNLHKKGSIFIARQLSEAAKARTGIHIHPGTVIGENLFIDHGTGDVIGETAKIGRNTQIMHKVTLGAYANPKEKRPEVLAHRHPEIGDDCFIAVGVEVLGNVKIGNNVKLLSKAMLHGNHIVIKDGVRIGTGAEIEDGCTIESGVKIGEGAFINKDSGEIKQDIPPHSEVFRDNNGVLNIIEGAPERFNRSKGIEKGPEWLI